MANRGNVRTHACPACGGNMVYEQRPEVVAYKGHQRSVPTVAWWCKACGEGVLSGAPLAKLDEVFVALKAEVDGTLTPAEVTHIRERLGLSKRAASDVLGGGPRSFQKYENGEVAVSQPMSNLLRLLANDPKRLDELRNRATRAAAGAHAPAATRPAKRKARKVA